MSTTPPPPSALTGSPRPVTPESPSDDGAFGWLRALGPSGRRAFGGAFGGYALDSYDYFTLPLTMVALSAYFGLNSGQTGLLTTVTLIVSAVGGALAGVLADRVGRVKALLLTVITYAVFTVACGFAPTTRRCWSSAPSRAWASAASGRSARSWSPSTPAPSTGAARSARCRAPGPWAGPWP